MGEECKKEGIPVHILGNAVSEAVRSMLGNHQQYNENDDIDNKEMTTTSSGDGQSQSLQQQQQEKVPLFNDADEEAWKVVVDYATTKMTII